MGLGPRRARTSSASDLVGLGPRRPRTSLASDVGSVGPRTNYDNPSTSRNLIQYLSSTFLSAGLSVDYRSTLKFFEVTDVVTFSQRGTVGPRRSPWSNNPTFKN
ncbi:hypothetical protein J6590_032906 [Homalodisca vitripennis]|nr:hypothetical protein J6590_032906 [Homalodisca vitripennis]